VSRYPLILLDLDGTLVDSFADIAAGVRAACAHIGVAAADDLVALVRRGAPLEEIYELAVGAAVADDPRFVAFAGAYRAHYFDGHGCLSSTVVFHGVRETLEALRARAPRPRLAVATTKRTETARRVLAGVGLLPLVDEVVGADGLAAKPDPATLVEAARRVGVDVRHAIMVGDTDRDVLAARRAGCAAAAVTYGGMPREELAASGPDHLLDRFGELLAVVT
jgi:phosphoglycolate phosphatase